MRRTRRASAAARRTAGRDVCFGGVGGNKGVALDGQVEGVWHFVVGGEFCLLDSAFAAGAD